MGRIYNKIRLIGLFIVLSTFVSCAALQNKNGEDLNRISVEETRLGCSVYQAPSGHLGLCRVIRTTICVISVDEPIYQNKHLKPTDGLYTRIGTYTFNRADEKETPQTVAVFIKKSEIEKYGLESLKSYFSNVGFFINEP